MSTITKERVAEFIKKPLDNGLTRGEQMELARIALASLEADGTLANEGTITATQFKPVADLYEVTVPSGRSTTFTKDAAEASDCRVMGWSVQEYVKLDRYQAAMLQGAEPVSNRDELPDGWVACSERMPEMEIEVLAIHVEGHQEIVTVYHSDALQVACGHAYFDRSEYWWVGDSLEDAEPNGSFTHWMPLPAAPQQEA